MHEFLVYSSYVVGGVEFLTALIALHLFTRLSFSLKVISVYVVMASCSEMLAVALANVGESNLFLYHVYVFLEFFFLSVFFHYEFQRFGKSNHLKYFLPVGSFLIIANSIFIQPFNTFNSYSATLVGLLIIGYCIYYFLLSLEESNEDQLFNVLKWIVISIFIYQCVTIFILLFSNEIMEIRQEFHRIIWGFRSVILVIVKLIILFQFVKILIYKRLTNDGQ